jgi:cold shock CspA family protein
MFAHISALEQAGLTALTEKVNDHLRFVEGRKVLEATKVRLA